MRIPYANLSAEHAEIQSMLLDSIAQVLASGGFILGRTVESFEERFAALHRLPHAIGVGSGLDALGMALQAVGVGPGDEIITVPNSFIATAAAVTRLEARPVFVDVDEQQTMDPGSLEKAMTPRTRAIIPVHLTGRPAPMDAIMRIANRSGVPVIEDCAQAVGASLHGQSVGTFGVAGCYSFHPLKNLGACGDGGAVVTGDARLAARVRLLRNHGLEDRNTCARWGSNTRLDALQAAILATKLPRLESWTATRRRNAARYLAALGNLPLILPTERPGEHCVWHAFVIRLEARDALQAWLARQEVEALVHYPVPIHLQPAARSLGYGRGSFPCAEHQAGTILSLPVRPSLAEEDVEHVIRSVKSFFDGSNP